VKVLAILADHPGATPRSAAMLRIAVDYVAWHDDADVTLLLDGRALRLALGDLPERTGRYCVTHLIECVIARGGRIAASAVGLLVRGIAPATVRPGVTALMPLEIEELAEASDRVITL
jgi:hypothetical protein